MAIVATNLKRGQCIQYEGERGVVLGLEHRTPGKGNALIAATIRSFKTGKTKTIRFASSEKVDIVETDRQKLEFSYAEPGTYHFMDPHTYDTVGIDEGFIGDAKDFLKEGQMVEIEAAELINDKVLRGSNMGSNRFRVDMPNYVEFYLDGKLHLDSMISRRVGLADINAAFAEMKRGEIARSVITFDI